MFSVPRGSVRGSHERMVIEIKAALQMSFFLWRHQPLRFCLKKKGDVVSRSGRWTLQGWFTMVLWWTPYLYDFRGSHSPRSLGWHSDCFRCACFLKASQRLSLQMLHCVVQGYTHLALWQSKVYCPDVSVRIWNLFSVLVCDKVSRMVIAAFVLCVFCDELTLVDKWWLAYREPPTCDSLTELVIVLVLKTVTCRTV